MKPPLVIVHPSWPWESKGSLPEKSRERILHHCGMLLSRMADAVEEVPGSFLVGPFVESASFLPRHAQEDMARLVNFTIPLTGGLEEADFQKAAAEIAHQLPRGIKSTRLAGFWSDVCVKKMGEALKDWGILSVLAKDMTARFEGDRAHQEEHPSIANLQTSDLPGLPHGHARSR